MGLKDLIRKPLPEPTTSEANDEAALAFIAGAPVSATAKPKLTRRRKKAPTFVRTTFSLSKDVNKQIDKISLIPRAFRVTRSDVIRAGIIALKRLDRADLLALLEDASKADPIDGLEEPDENE